MECRTIKFRVFQNLSRTLWILLAFLAGCAHIPTRELNEYKETFISARTSSEDVLIQFAAIKKESIEFQDEVKAEKEVAKKHPPLYPVEFLPARALTDETQDADITLRVEAWDTLARYNDVLIALAEGRSPQEVKNSFDSLAANVETFAETLETTLPAAFGPAASAISGFLELAEKARSRAEFVRGVKEGQPIISTIIENVFLPDTKDFYQMAKVLTDQKLIDIRIIIRKDIKSMILLVGTHAEPQVPSSASPQPSDLSKEKADVRKRLTAVLKDIGMAEKTITIANKTRRLDDFAGVAITSATKPPAYTELVQGQLVQFINSVESSMQERQKLSDYMNSLNELMINYARLLYELKFAIKTLRVAVDQPANLEQVTRELVGLTITVRSNIAALKNN